MSNTIGKNIKKLRRQNAVKQDVLASSLHLRRQTVSSYERGVTLPNIFILIRIADYFDVTLDELTGRTELAVQKEECFLQALFPQKCRLTSSKLHGEFPQYCISSAGTLSGAGEEPLQAYKVY